MRVPAECVEIFSWFQEYARAQVASKSLVSCLKQVSHHAVLLNESLFSLLYIIKAPKDGSD